MFEEVYYGDYIGGDLVDWVLVNNLIFVVLFSVFGFVFVFVVIFWFVWCFQQFWIIGDYVEVCKGIIFCLYWWVLFDWVQGVNLI